MLFFQKKAIFTQNFFKSKVKLFVIVLRLDCEN